MGDLGQLGVVNKVGQGEGSGEQTLERRDLGSWAIAIGEKRAGGVVGGRCWWSGFDLKVW